MQPATRDLLVRKPAEMLLGPPLPRLLPDRIVLREELIKLRVVSKVGVAGRFNIKSITSWIYAVARVGVSSLAVTRFDIAIIRRATEGVMPADCVFN